MSQLTITRIGVPRFAAAGRDLPSSYQVRELDAEALESQGKWDEATAEYRKIPEQNPKLPQIHYRLGRILLAKPAMPTTSQDAEKEFQEELKIDPDNASAEFMLGELPGRPETGTLRFNTFFVRQNLIPGSSLNVRVLTRLMCQSIRYRWEHRAAQLLSPSWSLVRLRPLRWPVWSSRW